MNEEDMDSVQTLSLPSDLSPSAFTFLNAKFHTKDNVDEAPSLVSELQTQCSDLDQALVELNRRLGAGLVAYSSFSGQIHDLFNDVNAKLTVFTSSCSSSIIPDGPSGEKNFREELPALAKEVARLETVRVYAETALKLVSLVGDIEDAVSYTMNKNLRKHSSSQNSDELRLLAIKTLKTTEEVLATITKRHPQWKHLVSAVDHRADRALAILRPQAIADHRALLASLGWPPPLSSSASDSRSVNEVSNPLLSMQADLKLKYSENFLALCSLQELQRQRKARQLEGYDLKVAQDQPLWAIEELVNPISLASQQHFSKWVNKPELIFTLAYKISRDYVDSMDELLQPLVDEAKLVGYSCREEWISAMVTSLSTYLAKEIFPIYINQLEGESATSSLSSARISWLHLIDLMISFDKRIKSLVEHSGILLSFEEDGILQKISSFSVFCDRPDWLDLWAEIELNDALDKLKSVTDEEKNWRKQIEGVVLSSCTDGYKSPLVSNAFLRHLASLIDRCRSLPSVTLRSRFLKLAAVPIVRNFFDCILIRCQEAEGLTALTDDDALIKVAISINAAHYFESVLREWSEDVFFLEMGMDQDDKVELPVNPDRDNEGLSESRQISIFDEDIKKLEEFRKEWVEKISVVILRGFDARLREYVKNRRQWQHSEDGWTISKTLIEALDYLQGKMSVVERSLNSRDFVGAWRSLAAGIDRLIFTGILIGNVKFHNGGLERFGNDLGVLFGVFGAWCLRPEGFFPKASEGLKLLRMEENKMHECLAGGKNWLKENGIRHLTVTEAEKIVKSRVFTS
ncbi:RINT1-like protein MAG2 [Neltuma alba]|uniref:RINT1-like protein MAG2 n=1 Tax=Neltuma alba TaxID=207710 RepID=UPI0010A41A35|nr:RINT1-like protein MAG2 [Prosopis alba]XP_028763433.1 RINT1-like protein MAG2 [Prosopis alba]